MDRVMIYPGAIPLETDLLQAQKNAMISGSKILEAILGAGGTWLNGLACTQTTVASLNVQVGPGMVYAPATIDATAFSSLAADTAHNILKQGILLDAVTLSCPAPGTAGFSINYLIQVGFLESDSGAVVLPYYNASNPSVAYTGPNNSGTAQNTARKGVCSVLVKAGIAAATGSQVTPTADAGYVGAYVVTVAYGQTQITAPNISQVTGAPFLPTGGFVISGFQGGCFTSAVSGGTADAITGTFTPGITSLINGMALSVRAGTANATTTPTFTPNSGVIAAKTIVKGNNLALVAGDISGAGHWIDLQYDSTLDKWVMLNPATGVTSFTPASVVGSAKNLKVSAVGISNYNCVITADEVVLENAAGQYMTVRSVNKTINANGTVGAPLSIMSARAASTWYFRWLWYNSTNGLTAALDASNTAPTAPTGYASTDFKALLSGACRTDSSGSTYLMQTVTTNRNTQYEVLTGSNTAALPLMASGTAGSISTPTYVAVGTANFVPTNAGAIKLLCATNGSTVAIVAPNNSCGADSSLTNPPPIDTRGFYSILSGFMLTSSNIYWASASTAAYLYCFGWED